MTEIILIYFYLAIGVGIRYFLAYLYKIYSEQIVLFGWEDFFKRMQWRYIFTAIVTFLSAIPLDMVFSFTQFPDPHGYIFALAYGVGGLTLMNFVIKYSEQYTKA